MTNEALKEIQKKYGSPCFVFDINAAKKRAGEIKALLGDKIKTCYAVKANAFLTKAMAQVCDKLEVCSPGELSICEKLNIDMKQVVFSGVNKTEQDVKQAVKNNVLIYTVESEKHLFLLNRDGENLNKKLPILLRLSNGSQFGIDEKAICKIIENLSDHKGVCIEGLHFFTGTQKKKIEEVIAEIEYVDNFCDRLKNDYDFTVKKLEYGTGLKTPYFENEDFSDTLLPLKQIVPSLNSISSKYEITIEMGRFFASESGYYITQVVDTKCNNATNYCIVDGGINHINYYGQIVAMKKPIMRHFAQDDWAEHIDKGKILSSNTEQKSVKNCTDTSKETENNQDFQQWTVCGSLCTTADIIVKNAGFTRLLQGDTIVFENLGAYSVTESPYLFLSRKMPRVILCEGKEITMARDFVETYVFNSI